MARKKEVFTVTGPSKDPKKHRAPWCCHWWEVVTDREGTSEKRRHTWFATKREARTWGEQKERDRLQVVRSLSDAERMEYLHYQNLCAARGLAFRDVMDEGLRAFGGVAREFSEVEVEDAKELYLIWMQSRDARPDTIRNLEGSVNWLIRVMDGERFVSSFTAREVLGVVFDRYPDVRVSQGNFLADLRSFFKWAAMENDQKRAYCDARVGEALVLPAVSVKSTAAEADADRTLDHKPRMSVEQIKGVFGAVDVRFHPMLALGIAGGLRPKGALVLTEWRMMEGALFYGIDFEERLIRLNKEWVTKTREHRNISGLPDWFWDVMEVFRPGKLDGVRVAGINYRNLRKSVYMPCRDALGLDAWPHDWMRHTALSFSFVLNGQAVTMNNAGHSNAKTFFRHYNNAVSGSEAKAFAALRYQDGVLG